MKNRIKTILYKFIIYFFFITIFSLISSGCNKKSPIAINGIIDLSDWDFEKDGIIKLDGDWKFYWHQLLTPDDFLLQKQPEKIGLIKIPGIWNSYKINNKKIYGEGYATFKLTVKVKNPETIYALKTLSMATAYKLWVNGILVSSNGKVGKSEETMIPQLFPKITIIKRPSTTYNIILQVSNFYHRKGGIWKSIRFGEKSQIVKKREHGLAIDFFLFGSIIIMAIYHFGLFLLRRKDPTSLYFAIFTLIISIRIGATGNTFLMHFFPNLNWSIAYRLDYFTFILAIPALSMFIHSIFPDEFSKKILRILQIIGAIFFLIVLIAPSQIYTYFAIPYDIVILLAVIYSIYIAIIATLNKREGGKLFLISFIVFLSVAINDILYLQQVINTFFSIPYGILFLIVVQSFSLSVRFSKSFATVEIQSKKLHQISSYLNNIINSMPSILIGLNSEDKVSLWNFEAEEITGISEEKALGQSLKIVLPQMSSEIEKASDYFKIKKPVKIEKFKYNQEQEVHYSDIMIYPLNVDSIKETILRIDDVTEMEKKDTQLRQSQKMETVGTLAGGLAHDFNNVLGGIIGALSLYRNNMKKGVEPSSKTMERYLDIIEESGDRAADMVKQLLTLSRKQKVSFTPVDLNNSIKYVLKICSNSIDKSVRLKPHYTKSAAMTNADPVQIEQVLLNLCLNASHAMTIMREDDETWGGVLDISIETISADKHFIKIHSHVKELDYWMISIKDSGIGMTKETIAKIFNPFFTTKEKDKGTGLGLSMVYNIIHQHNGFIDVYSEIGLGSSFNIYLPVLEDEILSKTNNEKRKEIPKGEGLILVVDDEKVIREVAKDILNECGYDTLLAKNGKEGLDLFRKRSKEIKVIILDMVMPVMSGDSAYIEMKKIDPQLKVLLASGFRQDDRIQKVLDSGADGFIQKPFTLDRLAEAINKIVK